MQLKPLDDRVVVKPLDAEETTAGGIVLPGSAQEKPQRGEVLPSVRGACWRAANAQPSALSWATKFCLASTAGPTSKSKTSK